MKRPTTFDGILFCVPSLIVVSVVSTAVLRAQQPVQTTAPAPSFEAASVKPSPSNDGSIFAGCHEQGDTVTPAGRCIFRGAPLTWVVAVAYGFRPMLAAEWLIGEPAWVNSQRYDIEAKAENDAASPADLRLMLRNLLADRFKLALHESIKEVAGYALVVAKSGPTMTKGDVATRSGIASNAGRINANNASIARLAIALSRELRAPVIDMTNLSGNYSFTLTFDADGSNVSAPSIFTALQEQLGLRLESRRVPTRVLIIDHIEKPGEN